MIWTGVDNFEIELFGEIQEYLLHRTGKDFQFNFYVDEGLGRYSLALFSSHFVLRLPHNYFTDHFLC